MTTRARDEITLTIRAPLAAGGAHETVVRLRLAWLRWLLSGALLGVIGGAGAIIIHSVLVTFRYRYVFPYWDMASLQYLYFQQLLSEFLIFRDNEHIPIFAMPLFIADNVLFGAQGLFLIGLSLAMTLAIIALLWRPLFASFKRLDLGAAAAAALLAASLLWLSNWENLIWPKQIHMYLSLLAFTAAAALTAGARRPGGGRLTLIVACLIVAMFSFGYGAIGWIAVLATAVALRWSWRALLSLALPFVGCVALYAHLYNRLTLQAHSPFESLYHPGRLVLYVGTYLAAPLIAGLQAVLPLDGAVQAARLGTLLVGLWLLWRLWALRLRPPTATECWAGMMILFALGTAMTTAMARSVFGTLQSLDSRYMIAQLPFWIGVALLALEGIKPRPALQRITVAVLGLALLIGFGSTQRRALDRVREVNADHWQAVMSILTGVEDEAVLTARIQPNIEFVRSLVGNLKAQEWSVFAWPQARWMGQTVGSIFVPAPAADCVGWIDHAEDLPAASATDGTTPGSLVSGWAWQPVAGVAPHWIVLADGAGVIRGLGHTGMRRPDVAATMGGPRMLNSGWRGYARAGSSERLDVFAVINEDRSLCALKHDQNVAMAPMAE